MSIPNEPRLWRTVDGLRSRSGDDYCILHGDFRCPDCTEVDRDWADFDAETWEPESSAAARDGSGSEQSERVATTPTSDGKGGKP